MQWKKKHIARGVASLPHVIPELDGGAGLKTKGRNFIGAGCKY
jgi:hypothetical protein